MKGPGLWYFVVVGCLSDKFPVCLVSCVASDTDFEETGNRTSQPIEWSTKQSTKAPDEWDMKTIRFLGLNFMTRMCS